MGFFDKLLGGGALKTPDELHPVIGPALATLRGADGRQVVALFQQGRAQRDFGLCLKLVLLSVTDYVTTFNEAMREQMLDGLVPSDPFWMLVRGRFRFEQGWAARGTGRAGSVNDERWRVLEQRCNEAQSDFDQVAARDRHNPVPYALMLDVLRGLGRPKSETRSRADALYGQAMAVDPLFLDAHRRMLTILSERWFGSHDEMRRLALHVASSVPDGSDAAFLPVDAHWDAFTHKKSMDKDEAAASHHLADPGVRHEISTAVARSIDSPSYRPTTATLGMRHQAAALAWSMGDHATVRFQLSLVGNSFAKSFWSQLDWKNTEAFYKSVRKHVGV